MKKKGTGGAALFGFCGSSHLAARPSWWVVSSLPPGVFVLQKPGGPAVRGPRGRLESVVFIGSRDEDVL